MKITIKDIRSGSVYVDKDNLSHFKGDEIVNLHINTDDKDMKSIYINVIGYLNNFTSNELIVYKYIINNIVKGVVRINTSAIHRIAKTNYISNSSISRAINSLRDKDIIAPSIKDGNIILTEYVINEDYDISKYDFEDDKPKVIVIFTDELASDIAKKTTSSII